MGLHAISNRDKVIAIATAQTNRTTLRLRAVRGEEGDSALHCTVNCN